MAKGRKRRVWTDDEKRIVCAQTRMPGVSVSQVARRYDVNANLGLFAKGLVLNLSNPKAVVAWMAALSVGLGADDSLANVVVATLGCALIGLLIYAAYAVAFSLSAVMHGYRRFRHWVDGMVSALFAVAGITLLRSAITRN